MDGAEQFVWLLYSLMLSYDIDDYNSMVIHAIIK